LGGMTTEGVGHLWSLSVEEQFYLLWPVVLITARRFGPRALFGVSLAIFGVSASTPLWGLRSYGDLFTGLDLRAQELMSAPLLAQLRFGGCVALSVVHRRDSWLAVAAAVACYAGLLVFFPPRVAFLDYGMYTCVAVLAGLIVCAATYCPPRLLTNAVMRYVGS